MIIEDREIIPWNDGNWSEDLYRLTGRTPHPVAIIDEIEGYIYKPMMLVGRGEIIYYRMEMK